MSTDTSFVTDWFNQLCSDAADGHEAFRWFDGGTPGRMMLEVLSDASSELFCSAILAAHLRRFGTQRFASNKFWARCEWAKFDLSYGLATNVFEDWNRAWAMGVTGDLGTIEVKVIYGHYAESTVLAKVAELGAQLQARHRQIATWRGSGAQDDAAYGYHGLLLLVGARDLPTNAVDRTCKQVRLSPIVRWTSLGEMARDELGAMWPRSNIRHGWELKAQLVAGTNR